MESPVAEFVVKEIAGSWAVVRDFIILAERRTAEAAIACAIGLATQAALDESACRVIYEMSKTERTVAWESERERARGVDE